MLIGVDGNEANIKNRVGSGKYAHELLLEFSKNKEHDFLIYLKDSPQEDLPKESKNFKYKVFGPKKLWTQFALPISLTFGPKPDVFFSMAHYGPRFSRVPYVVTIHDLSYLHFPELFNKDDLYQLKNWSKYSIEKSAHVIVPSKSTAEDVVKNYNVPSSKITVTYEGYDQDLFKPQKKPKVESVKSKYQIRGDYIIFVGTLQPRKNLERLIEAFNLIVNGSSQVVDSYEKSMSLDPQFSSSTRTASSAYEPSTMNLQLVICGKKGWMFERIFEKVQELKLQDKVTFAGFVEDNDLPALISGARVYVNPSLWEGFGIPVIEAQACGVPVVVSNTSSLPEIVGDSGVLIDPTETNSIATGIKKVLEGPKLSSELVKKGSQNIKRFSWQNCAQQTLEILTSCV